MGFVNNKLICSEVNHSLVTDTIYLELVIAIIMINSSLRNYSAKTAILSFLEEITSCSFVFYR